MKDFKFYGCFAGGLAVGLAGGWLLAQSKQKQSIMPHLEIWRSELECRYGTVRAGFLAAQIQAQYETLWAQRPRFAQEMLNWHLRQGILPGLALYRVLRTQYETEAEALGEAERFFEPAYRGSAAIFPLFKRLPGNFELFRVVCREVMARQYPPAGWETVYVEDSSECLAFDIRERCLYRDVLTALQAPELTPVFCKMDDLVYAQLAPEINFIRTKTMGRGDECCNFRFCRGSRV
jgi:hypothetical protein